jgi:hypothetical protein
MAASRVERRHSVGSESGVVFSMSALKLIQSSWWLYSGRRRVCSKIAALAGYERDVPIIDAKLSEPADRILIQQLVTI